MFTCIHMYIAALDTRIRFTKRVILAQEKDVNTSKRDQCVCILICIHVCIAALDGAHENMTHQEGNTGTEKRHQNSKGDRYV